MTTKDKVSDGMGGWIGGESEELCDIDVAVAPVRAEVMLKEYGIVNTESMTFYTEDDIPEGDIHINYNDKNYRIVQLSDYGLEKVILVELMR